MTVRWTGRRSDQPQVANACPHVVDLRPDPAPAEQTRSNWSAVLPDQPVPLIWERHDGGEEGC